MIAAPPSASRNSVDDRLASWAALILRLALGAVFLAHGWFKLAVLGLPGSAAFFERFGFPGWSAYPVAGLELLGGLALTAGWAVRPAALALLAVVLGAFRVHWPNGWYFGNPDGGWEYLALLLVALLVQVLLGPGAASLDARPAGREVRRVGGKQTTPRGPERRSAAPALALSESRGSPPAAPPGSASPA